MESLESLVLLQYPIGPCPQPQSLSQAERYAALGAIETFPAELASALKGFNEIQLDTPYRPGGWSVRTLVHHLADCHLIAYTWTKLALTSDRWPMVFDYNVDSLAVLPDSRLHPVISLQILDSVHRRWTTVLRAMSSSDFAAHGYTHPATGRCSLDQMLAMYGWHGRHHLSQILHCRERNGW